MLAKKIIAILFFLNTGLFAQDTVKVPIEPPPYVPPESIPVPPDPLDISPTPSAQELTDLFVLAAQGQVDPFAVIGKLSRINDSSVAGLSELLFSETITVSPPKIAITGSDSFKETGVLERPNKLYAVLGLRAIGSQSAYDVLAQAADTHSEVNVRGTALQFIADDYHKKVRRENITPDKSIIHLFVKVLGNSAQVEFLYRTMDEVATEGLKKWIAENSSNEKISDGESWWLENKDKLTWNKEKGYFEFQ